MKTLTLICGLPGNGKTTLANKLPGMKIAADDYQGLYINGIYNPSRQAMAHYWCEKQVIKLMKEGVENIIVHNTFITQNSRDVYIKLALMNGYSTHLITSEMILLPEGNCTTSIHNVPKDVIERFKLQWENFFINPFFKQIKG